MFVLVCFGFASLKSFHVIYFPVGMEMFTLCNCISEVHNFIFDITEAQETEFRLCGVCVHACSLLDFSKTGVLTEPGTCSFR